MAIAQARRALKGNPRAPRVAHIHRALFDLGETLQRCSTSVESMAVVVLDPNAAPLAEDLRVRTSGLLTSLASLFDDKESDTFNLGPTSRKGPGMSPTLNGLSAA